MFRPEERSEARPSRYLLSSTRIKAISKGELVGKAVSDTIANAQVAMMTAINASIIASTSSSNTNQ